MGSIKIKNNAKSILANDITATANDLTVQIGDGVKFPALGKGDYFYITIADANDPTILEIVKVVDKVGDTFTIERAQEGTTALDWTAGALVEQRITVQTFIDSVGTFQDAPQRIYLDEILIARQKTNRFADATTMTIANHKYAPKLVSKWDTYWGSRVKCASVNITDGKYEDELEFLTMQDMYNYLIANVPELNGADQATVYIKPYETVDNSIPTITKIYGMNRFFSAMKGRRNYRKTISSCYLAHSTLTDPLLRIFNTLMSTTLTSAEIADVQKTIWLPNFKKANYGGFYPGHNTWTVDTTGFRRRVWNSNTNTFENANANELFAIDFTSVTYFGINDLASYTVSYPYIVKPNLIGKFILNDGYSFVIAAKFTSTVDANRHIIMAKPLGVDSFVIEYPDFNNYDLELVALNPFDQSLVDVLSVSSTADWAVDYDLDFGKIRFTLLDIKNIIYNAEGRTARSSYKSNLIKFRLRDKLTKKISPLSTMGIGMVFKNNIVAPGILMS